MNPERLLIFVLFFWACEPSGAEISKIFVSDVTVEVHPKVSTVLIVKWKQVEKTDNVYLRFTFENDEYFESPKKPGDIGDHSEVILGVPSETAVTFYVVSETGGDETEGEQFQGTTGALPTQMPSPTLVSYNTSIASVSRWTLGSVELSKSSSSYYGGDFWVYIMDRQARVVWYLRDPLDGRILFPMVSADGTHIIYDVNGYVGEERISSIKRTTLDFEYGDELDMGEMNWDYAEKPNGTILYSAVEWGKTGSSLLELKKRLADGTITEIWDCENWAASVGVDMFCYSNTVNWNFERGTVLLSMPFINTVLEIDEQNGEVRSQWGDAPGSWNFSPPEAGLEFNHYPNITKDNTLLVSSHLPGGTQPGEHRIMEFEIDEENKTLTEIWSFKEGLDEWPEFSGEATRLENGNTLVNFGSGGSIFEVTPDKQVAWHVLWDAAFTEVEDNNLCGHTVLIKDLYALNEGPDI